MPVSCAIWKRPVLWTGVLLLLLVWSMSLHAVDVAAADKPGQGRCAVLLHGLARTSWSMRPIARTLEDAGWRIVNQGYPSRSERIEALASRVQEGFDQCLRLVSASTEVDVVTHSMGGLLLRQWHTNTATPFGRAVMLGPPNQGSELVDYLGRTVAFQFYNGPAGMQLGTGQDAHWRLLPAVGFDLGVIAGRGQESGLLGRHVPAPNDGKVSVASTRVAGMQDHIALEVGHTFLMNSEAVQRQVLAFLVRGRFDQP